MLPARLPAVPLACPPLSRFAGSQKKPQRRLRRWRCRARFGSRVLVARSFLTSQCELCPLPPFEPVSKAVGAPVDPPRQRDEIARIGQFIAPTICPPPGGSPGGELGPLQQLGSAHAVYAHGAGHCFVIRPPCDLDQSAPTESAAITRLSVAQVFPALVSLLRFCRPPYLAGIDEAARLMADLGEKRSQPYWCGDLELDARSPDIGVPVLRPAGR